MVRINRNRLSGMLDEAQKDEVVISTAKHEPVSVEGVAVVVSDEILDEQWPQILGGGLLHQKEVVELSTQVEVLLDRETGVTIIRPSDTGLATFVMKAEYDSQAGIIPVVTVSLELNGKSASGTIFQGLDEEDIHLMFDPREIVSRISAVIGGVRLDEHPEIKMILEEDPE